MCGKIDLFLQAPPDTVLTVELNHCLLVVREYKILPGENPFRLLIDVDLRVADAVSKQGCSCAWCGGRGVAGGSATFAHSAE